MLTWPNPKHLDASMFASLVASILATNPCFKLEFPDQGTGAIRMETSLTPDHARAKFRKTIQAYFRKLVHDVRSADGSLPEVGKQIGVTRQMLEQYAAGSLPKADVLLT